MARRTRVLSTLPLVAVAVSLVMAVAWGDAANLPARSAALGHHAATARLDATGVAPAIARAASIDLDARFGAGTGHQRMRPERAARSDRGTRSRHRHLRRQHAGRNGHGKRHRHAKSRAGSKSRHGHRRHRRHRRHHHRRHEGHHRPRVSTLVPTGPDLCSFEPRWGQYAIQSTVRALAAAAGLFASPRDGRLALGDVSRLGGGVFWPHVSHRVGMDADIRPVRRDGRQCQEGTTWRSRSYDRAGTIRLIRAVRQGARGRIRLVFFDDPVLIRRGLTRYWPGHDNHLHVSFCLPHARPAAYRC